MSDKPKEPPKPDELKKNHPELNPDKGKTVVIELTPDDHFDQVPSHLRKHPKGGE